MFFVAIVIYFSMFGAKHDVLHLEYLPNGVIMGHVQISVYEGTE